MCVCVRARVHEVQMPWCVGLRAEVSQSIRRLFIRRDFERARLKGLRQGGICTVAQKGGGSEGGGVAAARIKNYLTTFLLFARSPSLWHKKKKVKSCRRGGTCRGAHFFSCFWVTHGVGERFLFLWHDESSEFHASLSRSCSLFRVPLLPTLHQKCINPCTFSLLAASRAG